MDGVAGLAGWRWIFILEGIATVVVGCSLYWTLPDSPQTASFLTQEERDFIIRRLRQDAGTAAGQVRTDDGFQWQYLRAALSDWKIYLAVIIYWGNSICLYGFTYSAPTIILELGYTAANAQLLTIPIYLVGVASTIFFSVMADRHQTRWPFIVGPYSVALLGFVGLLSIPHPRLPGLTYALLFTIPGGVYPPLIGCLSWVGNNIAPTWKRAIGMALLISIGNVSPPLTRALRKYVSQSEDFNLMHGFCEQRTWLTLHLSQLGGAVGSNIFLAKQAPHYWLGYGLALGMVAAAIIATFILRIAYGVLNKKRDGMNEEEIRAKYSEGKIPILVPAYTKEY